MKRPAAHADGPFLIEAGSADRSIPIIAPDLQDSAIAHRRSNAINSLIHRGHGPARTVGTEHADLISQREQAYSPLKRISKEVSA